MKHIDTAYWTAVYRAMESNRKHRLFYDPLAAGLAGERGRSIVQSMGRNSQGWQFILRTVLIDGIIDDLCQNAGLDGIVNLGCGLDTRPYRLNLPAELEWVEADLPDLVHMKERALCDQTPHCSLQRVAIDLTNESAIQNVIGHFSANRRRILAITEGVLVYLPAANVDSISERLQQHDALRYWAVDLSPPALAARIGKGADRPLDEAIYRFVPEDGIRFFQTRGWSLDRFRYTLEEAIRQRRAPFRLWFRNLTTRGSLGRSAGGVALLTRPTGQ